MRRSPRWVVLLLLLAPGCRSEKRPEGDEPAPVVRATEADGLRVTVTLQRPKVTVGDAVSLALRIEGAAGREVRWPDLESLTDQFRVKLLPEAVPPEGRVEPTPTLTRSYELRPLEAGPLIVPALEVRVAGGSAATQPAEETVLTTEAISMDVASAAPAGANPASRPAAIDDPLALPRARSFAWAVWLTGLVAVILLSAWFIRFLRRRAGRPAPAPAVPPLEWALAALRRLRGRDLIAAGLVQEFYFELNMIVRQYVERQFGLRAPEMTTEEFLVSLRGQAALDQQSQAALLPFLEACDLVKYARYQPAAPEIRQVDRTAEEFILQSAGRSPAVPSAATELEAILEGAAR